MKNSFVVYHEIIDQTTMLTDEQMGQLFRAMINFSRDMEPEINDAFVALAFSFVKPTMERDRRKYDEVCAKRQEAGRKGGRPRKQQQPTEGGDFLPENQMVSKKADNVNVPVNDNVPVHEDVYVSVLDCQDTQDEQDGQDRQTNDRDSYERDFQDALSYAGKMGYQLTGKQKKKLRYFIKFFSFDVVTMAIDRAVFHGGKSATYVFRILQEWQDNNLQDPDAINAYIAEREGSDIACAV